MATCLVEEFLRDCESDNASGGVFNYVYVAKLSDVASVAMTGNVVTAITMNALAVFYRIGFRPERSNFTEELNDRSTTNSISWTQRLLVELSAHSPETRDFIEGLAACACGLVVVHQEDKDQWIWGLGDLVTGDPVRGSYVKVVAGSNNSGTALTDESTSTITLGAQVNRQAMKCTEDMSTLI